MLDKITPLILTYNESPNIERNLKRLYWAKSIIIVDSYSNDNTLNILERYPQIKIFQRKFDTHTNQWNYGLEKIKSDWVLSLDADYILSEELINEIANLSPDTPIDSYFINIKYCIWGQPIRSGLYPPRQVLFRKEKAIYINDGHTQILSVNGKNDKLSSYIYHDDRKSLTRWLWAQDRYINIEAKKILETPENQLSLADRLRKQKIFAPFIILFYCLILKGGIFDGWAGLYYALQRTLAEILLSITIIENEKRSGTNSNYMSSK